MIRIIIYDDHQERRDSLRAFLSLTNDMQCVASFPDCSHVHDDMVQYHPDIVLMDIEMPGVDGISGVSIIKKSFPDIKIIMQTVFEDAERIFASLKAGAEGYILKNVTADKITQSIEEVYHGGAYMTPSVALKVMNYFGKTDKKEVTYSLTAREREVLQNLTGGMSYKMIADKLGISYFTVNGHIRKIYEKLHVHSLGEAVALAFKNRIV